MSTKPRRGSGQGNLRKRVDSGVWIARWYDHRGRRREKSTRTTDRRVAERILAKHIADSAIRREGVITTQQDTLAAAAAKPFKEHLAAFVLKLRTAGRTEHHVCSQQNFIQAAADHASWDTIAQITADDVNSYARSLEEDNRSAQTIKNHLTAVCGFTRWLTRHHKLPMDPLASVVKPNASAKRKRERRMLLHEEWDWIRSTTESEGLVRYNMAADERVLLYATAIQTGLRSNELRSLSRGNLFLTTKPPYLTLKARTTKNRKDCRQYIQQDVANRLREHASKKTPGARVFAKPAKWLVADMFREDVAAARAAWLKAAEHDPEEYEKRLEGDFLAADNAEGEHLDFHSLRHTCGAWLALTAAHPKVIQTIMRHSTITLTMDTYGHLIPGQESDAIANLPAMIAAPVAVAETA